MSEVGPERCPECGAGLAPGQGYCLACGARAGARSPQLTALLGRSGPSSGDAATNAAPVAAGEGSGATASPLRLPPPKVSALLVLMFLGFGALLGSATGPRVDDTLATSARRVKVVVPASPGSTTASTSPGSSSSGSSSGSASAGGGEPPAAQSEATPSPAPSSSPAAKPTPAPAASPPSSSSTGSEGGGGGSGQPTKKEKPKLPAIRHVFVIMLSDQPYAAAFGPASTASYLTGTLERRGALLVHYDAVAHEELANGVALISGQGPTAETALNCPNYSAIAPTGVGEDGQVLGAGCVYPSSTATLPGQLAAKHMSWRAYVEGIDEAGAGDGACAHPALGQADPTAVQTASTGAYATFRNPFVYFQSLTGGSSCASGDVGLGSLAADLGSARRTPNVSYIVPDRCHDGNPTPCTPGAAAGMGPADAFLRRVVPQIEGSSAYKQDGLLVITVDEAPSSGAFADSSSCCGQPRYPNLAATTPKSLFPKGGGLVGALLLSPFIKSAETSQEPYNHFSLLRTIEDLFGLTHLGYANLAGVKSLEPSLFTATAVG